MRYIKLTGVIVISVVPALLIYMLCMPGGTIAGWQIVTTAEDQANLAVTIYNQSTALVKDTRLLDLPRGQFDLVYRDVAASIVPTSVYLRSNTNPDSIEILEQNYEYDLVSIDTLYQRHIYERVTVHTEDGRTIEGTLIAFDDNPVVSTEEGIVIVSNPSDVTFEELPEGLITRPALRWSLISNRVGNNECEMGYLTYGISWRANYVAVVGQDDDVLDLRGWATIDNNSGASYYDADLKLVAGRLHWDWGFGRGISFAPSAPGFEEESFFEYHLYTLQRPATVLSHQQKQIAFLEGEGISVEKILLLEPSYSSYYGGYGWQGPIQIRLRFLNSEQNGLGIPIPAGIIRIYKEDSSGALQFVGEDRVGHTPKDEEIEIFLGEAFDIIAESVCLRSQRIESNVSEYDEQVTIRNHKDESVEVVYRDQPTGDWEVVKSSHEYRRRDASTVEFIIPVESDGETVLTYTIRREW